MYGVKKRRIMYYYIKVYFQKKKKGTFTHTLFARWMFAIALYHCD